MKNNGRKKRDLKDIFNWAFWAVMVLVISGVLTAVGGYFYLARDLPPLYSLRNYNPPLVTQIYSDDGTLIMEYSTEIKENKRRRLVPMEEVPEIVQKAFVAAEDKRFWQHPGVDVYGIIRAIIKAVFIRMDFNFQATSTITQQLARTFFLTQERTITRKVKEFILAIRIERYLTKKEILWLYLNQIDLGRGNEGIGAASEYYFGKPASELNLAEAAMLAGMPPAPNRYNPVANFRNAKLKQKLVLKSMVEEGIITQEESDQAYATPIYVAWARPPRGDDAPDFTRQVTRILIERYGVDQVYGGGLRVFTTVNIEADRVAREAVKKNVVGPAGVDKALGYRGPLSEKPLSTEEIESVLEKQEDSLAEDWIIARQEEVFKAGKAGEISRKDVQAMVPVPVPLEPGERYQAVIMQVDDGLMEAWAMIGKSPGRIGKAEMQWARRPYDREGKGWDVDAKLQKPSKFLHPGDLVMVSVIKQVDDGKGNKYYQLSLEQDNEIEGGLISMSTRTGHVKALCGGVKGKFIRPIQAKRQPGSAFKPVIYGLAFEMKRYTTANIIIDGPIIFHEDMTNPNCPKEVKIWERYAPKNYNDKFLGPHTVRFALANSINTIAIKICWDLCLPNVIDFARRLGIKSHLDKLPCLALGCSEVSLEELTTAYNVYASGGYLIKPTYITRVYDREGNLLEFEEPFREVGMKAQYTPSADGLIEEDIKESRRRVFKGGKHVYLDRPTAPQLLDERTFEQYLDKIKNSSRSWIPSASAPVDESRRVISPQTAYLINSLLQSVIKEGTAMPAYWGLNRRPAAGKTGTTNEYRDAWFMGYTPELITGVWIGADNYYYPLGEGMTGGHAALPVWIDYMKKVLEGHPPTEFPIPSGIEFVSIDMRNGLLAQECTPREHVRGEAFVRGTAPKKYSPCTDTGSIINDHDMYRAMESTNYTNPQPKQGSTN